MNQTDRCETAKAVIDQTDEALEPEEKMPIDPKPVAAPAQGAPTEMALATKPEAEASSTTTLTTTTTTKTVTTSSSIGPIKPTSMVRRSNPSDLLKNLKSVDKRQQKKPTILQQASRDWVKSKIEDNLEDELKQATKSKSGYLDKQNFLQRSDLRQFEKEREIRDRVRARTTTSHKRS